MNITRQYKSIFIFVLVCMCILHTQAQTLKAEVDRDKILLGEQITLKLTVENAKATRSFFNVPDSFNHIEVVERQKIDTIQIGNITNYQQLITLTSFDSGTWLIPNLGVQGINQQTAPIAISILPVDVRDLKDYHDIKEIIEVSQVYNWWIIAALIVAAIFSIIMVYVFAKRKSEVTVAAPVLKGDVSAQQWALSELQKLKQKTSLQQPEVMPYYISLTEIARQFFYRHLLQASPYQTTDEWMIHLQELQVDSSIKNEFFQTLRLADAVKFAKYIPPTDAHLNAVEAAIRMITSVPEINLAYPKTQPA